MIDQFLFRGKLQVALQTFQAISRHRMRGHARGEFTRPAQRTRVQAQPVLPGARTHTHTVRTGGSGTRPATRNDRRARGPRTLIEGIMRTRGGGILIRSKTTTKMS